MYKCDCKSGKYEVNSRAEDVQDVYNAAFFLLLIIMIIAACFIYRASGANATETKTPVKTELSQKEVIWT